MPRTVTLTLYTRDEAMEMVSKECPMRYIYPSTYEGVPDLKTGCRVLSQQHLSFFPSQNIFIKTADLKNLLNEGENNA